MTFGATSTSSRHSRTLRPLSIRSSLRHCSDCYGFSTGTCSAASSAQIPIRPCSIHFADSFVCRRCPWSEVCPGSCKVVRIDWTKVQRENIWRSEYAWELWACGRRTCLRTTCQIRDEFTGERCGPLLLQNEVQHLQNRFDGRGGLAASHITAATRSWSASAPTVILR